MGKGWHRGHWRKSIWLGSRPKDWLLGFSLRLFHPEHRTLPTSDFTQAECAWSQLLLRQNKYVHPSSGQQRIGQKATVTHRTWDWLYKRFFIMPGRSISVFHWLWGSGFEEAVKTSDISSRNTMFSVQNVGKNVQRDHLRWKKFGKYLPGLLSMTLCWSSLPAFSQSPPSPPWPHPQLCPSFNLLIDSLTDDRKHVLLPKWCNKFSDFFLSDTLIIEENIIYRPKNNEWGKDHWEECVFNTSSTLLKPGPFSLPHQLIVMGWMFASPENVYVEALTPNAMVSGAGTSGRWLDLDEVMKQDPQEGIRALSGRGRERSWFLLTPTYWGKAMWTHS